jgi:pSer/pThr/pTyr-binding forkhead associated (FHA) protein
VGNLHKLIIEDDEGKTTVVPLSRGEITVGRMEGNTIRLMERNVSRRHARLVRDAGSIFIEDLNSFNGVKINGERITKRLELREGDLVEIGDYHLALQAHAVEDDATSRVDTTLESAAPVVAKTNGSHGGAPGGWSAAAGTVPDLALTPDAMREARRQYEAATTDAPTANLRAATLGPPDPLVSPPTPKAPGGASLPPFPGPLPSPMFVEPGLAAQRAKDEAASRTEQIRVGAQRTADVTRLVCVSTEYAGRDFPLTRAETVIGRLEDNDVVIEHRSVSKQHAKILFDGRVHKIVDLESANGILVNGEEYAITDLRRGDLVELGHVKFRFVLAGEDFVPTAEEIDAMRAVGVEPQLGAARPSFGDAPTGPHAAPGAFASAYGSAAQASAAPTSGSAAALAALASGFGAPSSAAKAPSPSLRDPAPFSPEPPTVPLQTHLAQQLLPSAALRELASRDLASSARTEQMLAHDTVEMPVNMDLSNAATVTDTPISALEGELPKPRVEPVRVDPPREAPSDVPTQRPGERNGYGSGGARPVEPAFDGVRRGGSLGAVPTTRVATSDDEDLRAGRAEPRSTRGLMAGVAVLALVAGLVFVVLKLTGGNGSPGLDQELAALVQRGDLEKAESFYLANVEGFADKKKAAALFAEAKNKAAVQREAARPTPVPARPTPTEVAEARPTEARPTEAPQPSEAPAAEASAAPRPSEAVAEPIPEGEEPDSALVGRAVVSPGAPPAASPTRRERTAERPKRTPAADPKKSLDDAKRSYTDGFQAFMYGDPSRAKMHALSCLKAAEYPPCHSLLGRIYAQEDKVRESVRHYKQYLELAPNAPDASKVREIVANAEKSQ